MFVSSINQPIIFSIDHQEKIITLIIIIIIRETAIGYVQIKWAEIICKVKT